MRDGALSYSPFGVPDASVEGFAFTGEMRDANGLQYHRARYYSPELGVWPSLDPVEDGNRYAYVDGNPIGLVDPSGLLYERPPVDCREGWGIEAFSTGSCNDHDNEGSRCCGCMPNDQAYYWCVRSLVEPFDITGYCDEGCSDRCCGPDATEWLYREMINHRDYASNGMYVPEHVLDTIIDNIPREILRPIFAVSYATIDNAIRLAIYGLAVDYGYINYAKAAQASSALGQSSFIMEDAYSCTNAISVCGKCQNPSDYGNFILGIAIQAAGEDRIVAHFAGKIFNSLSGDVSASADNAGVLRGYDFATMLPSNYNRNDFCSRLIRMGTDWHDNLDCDSEGYQEPCGSAQANLNHTPHSIPYWNMFVSTTVYGGMNRRYSTPSDELLAKIQEYVN